MVKTTFYYICAVFSFFLMACGSGEFEREDIEVTTTEKKLVYDTLKTTDVDLTNRDGNDKIKDNLNNNDIKKDTYTYTVQIGAYVNPLNFQRFYDRSKSVLGESVYYKQIDNLYRIRIGSFDLKADAINYMEKLKGMGFADAFVVTTKK